jgi:CDP-diacylglycerol--glycerol-3-phosphate 3-phosphatidyltransferase
MLGLVTGSRLLFAAGVAVLTPWSGQAAWAVAASLVLIGLVEATDLADGYLARRHGLVSEFGRLFDPYCDSVSRLVVYWSLAVVGRCLAVVPLVMAVRDVTVSYARIIMRRRGMDVGARLAGKLKAIVQGVCAFALMSACPAWMGDAARAGVFWVGSIAVLGVTLASMLDYCLAVVADPVRPAAGDEEVGQP